MNLIKEPPVKLTKEEKNWWDWAMEGLNDISDEPSMKTLEAQIEDLKYRLTEQAYGVVEGASIPMGQYRAEVRVLNSLNNKLDNFYNHR